MSTATAKAIAVKDGNKIDGKATALKIAERAGTPSLVWLLVKRHKVAILVTGNIILVLNWVFPPWAWIVSDFMSQLF